MATVASTHALSASRAASIRGASALKARARSNARPAVRARNAQTTTRAYFDDGADFGGGDSGVDPESLAILQQRLGQRIDLEGEGAERLNQTAGLLLDASGRAIDKDERKKVLKADEAGQAQQALEISYDPDGLFPDVDDTSASMLIDKNLKAKEVELEKKEEEELRKE